jgi:hypothetical protein
MDAYMQGSEDANQRNDYRPGVSNNFWQYTRGYLRNKLNIKLPFSGRSFRIELSDLAVSDPTSKEEKK